MKRRNKILLAVLIVLALLALTVRFLPGILWGDGHDYSSVHSIRQERAFQDAALLRKAWSLPVAALYKKRLDFQANGSFCGPTSVVNVMRSLGEDASQSSVLAGSGIDTFAGFLPGGITLDQLAGLARRRLPDVEVTVLRGLDEHAFRAEIVRANDPDRRLIANFHRGPLFAQGGGHHSPVAGYLAEEDLVFVLDVNRDYQPWLVPTDRFFEAVDTIDPVAKKKRGLLRLVTRATAGF